MVLQSSLAPGAHVPEREVLALAKAAVHMAQRSAYVVAHAETPMRHHVAARNRLEIQGLALAFK